jgi:hypothetical protein
MNERRKINFYNRPLLEKSAKMLPDRNLERYQCEFCEFTQPPTKPYFRALAEQGEHNKKEHPVEFPPPVVIMVYKA